FWRACRFLSPYWRIVAISIVAAFLFGLIATSGLGAMLPVLRVLVNGDSVQGWVDRQVLEKRLGVNLLEDPQKLQIIRIKPSGPAADAGVRPGVLIGSGESVPQTLSQLAAGDSVSIPGRAEPIRLSDAPWYLRTARRLAYALPTDPVMTIVAIFCLIAALGV